MIENIRNAMPVMMKALSTPCVAAALVVVALPVAMSLVVACVGALLVMSACDTWYGKLGILSNVRHLLPFCIALSVHACILSMKLPPSFGGEDCLPNKRVQCAVCSQTMHRNGLQTSVHDAL